MALPVMESMISRRAEAQAASNASHMKRMVVFSNAFGMYPSAFFPKEAGTTYRMPELLLPLERHRREMTIFSNLDHGLNIGHAGTPTFLTGIESKNARYHAEGNISVDQKAAEWLKATTRFPSLQTRVRGAKNSLSWTRNAVNLHGIGNKDLYEKLFLNLDAKSRTLQDQRYEQETSILDVVLEQAKTVHKGLGKNDKRKLDEYLNSVRSLETRFAQESQWLHKNKPKTNLRVPQDKFQRIEDEYDAHMELLALALQTDSTRVITYRQPINSILKSWDFSLGAHSLSHYNLDPRRREASQQKDSMFMELFADLIDMFKQTEDIHGQNLFESTLISYGSNLRTGHGLKGCPALYAGGALANLKYGEHIVLPQKDTPLANYWLTLVQQAGIPLDHFSHSTGSLSELVS